MFKGLFLKPCIIGIVADINQGKSMLLYNLIEDIRKKHDFRLVTFGLRVNMPGAVEIHTVAQLEYVKDSVIIVDELSRLFNLLNGKEKRLIENTLRMINHNNNVLILAAPPENYKKFISAKLDYVFFKKCTLADFINGSTLKNMVTGMRHECKGSAILNIPKNKAIYWDGEIFKEVPVKLLRKYDTKKNNKTILRPKKP